MSVKLVFVSCLRCGHRWAPRVVDVRKCPKCGSPYWNTPRIRPEKPALPRKPADVQPQ